MSRISIFFDNSALFAGIISSTGAARALLVLAEVGQISILISEQVIAETERGLARKAPLALPDYRQAIRVTNPLVLHNPTHEEIVSHKNIIAHQQDVSIVVAAMKAHVDYLVTLNRRHFIDDPNVAIRSGLRIGTPGDALHWIRTKHI